MQSTDSMFANYVFHSGKLSLRTSPTTIYLPLVHSNRSKSPATLGSRGENFRFLVELYQILQITERGASSHSGASVFFDYPIKWLFLITYFNLFVQLCALKKVEWRRDENRVDEQVVQVSFCEVGPMVQGHHALVSCLCDSSFPC
jgi:hypothetical protein